MIEPTAAQCTKNEIIKIDDSTEGRALWFYQMGGYVGRAIAIPDNSCINIYVWHNGEFPFRGSKTYEDCWCKCNNCDCCDAKLSKKEIIVEPIRVHICDPQQIIDMGTSLVEWFQ